MRVDSSYESPFFSALRTVSSLQYRTGVGTVQCRSDQTLHLLSDSTFDGVTLFSPCSRVLLPLVDDVVVVVALRRLDGSAILTSTYEVLKLTLDLDPYRSQKGSFEIRILILDVSTIFLEAKHLTCQLSTMTRVLFSFPKNSEHQDHHICSE